MRKSEYSMEKNTSSDRNRRRYRERVTAEGLWYFILHNIMSIVIFFILTISFELYGEKNSDIAFLFDIEYWKLVFTIFSILLISGIFSRIFSYIFLVIFFKYARKRIMRKFGDLNTGVNKIGFPFLITALIAAIAYSLGVVLILQQAIFSQQTFWTLVATYVIIKIVIFLSIKLLTQFKM